MAKNNVRWLDVGINQYTDQVGGRTLPAGNVANNYTPTPATPEDSTNISAHLNGIDVALGDVPQGAVEDIAPGSIALVNNRATFTTIPELTLNMGTSISFNLTIAVRYYTDTPANDRSEVFRIEGSNNYHDWDYTISSNSGGSGVNFQVTNQGLIQYTSSNVTGFTLGKITFRMDTTDI